MRKFLVALTLTASVMGWAQQFPVDFDDSFFKKSPYARWMRDPFKNPPGFAKSTAGKVEWPKLTSVNLLAPVHFAVLDGRNFTEGQFIDESRYISVIGQNFVIITEGNFDYELVIADPKKGSGEKK